MIIADTSAWIEAFKDADHPLVAALETDRLLVHAFVVGELVCGGLTPRHAQFGLIDRLPKAVVASHDEVIEMLLERRLGQIGIGWTDAHLLASAQITRASILTHDRRMIEAARLCGIET